MTTVGDVIGRARRELLGSTREEVNRLLTTIDADDAAVTVEFTPDGVSRGSVIEIDTEQMMVWEVNTATRGLTVQRAWNGSTAAAHTGGATVRVNPRFGASDLFGHACAEILALGGNPNGLFVMKSTTLTTYDFVNGGYEVGGLTDMLSPYTLEGQPDLILEWDRGANLLRAPYIVPPDTPYPTLLYRARFTVPADASATLASCNLPASCEDIVHLGVMIRAQAGREVSRNFPDSQGESRRSDEVPVGAQTQSLRGMMLLRQQRVAEEMAALHARYPTLLRRTRGPKA